MDAFKSPQHLLYVVIELKTSRIQLYHLVICIFAGILTLHQTLTGSLPDISEEDKRISEYLNVVLSRNKDKSPVHSRHIPPLLLFGYLHLPVMQVWQEN